MRHELLTQRALSCIGVNARKGTLSQHFVTHVIPPLQRPHQYSLLHFGGGGGGGVHTSIQESLKVISIQGWPYFRGPNDGSHFVHSISPPHSNPTPLQGRVLGCHPPASPT